MKDGGVGGRLDAHSSSSSGDGTFVGGYDVVVVSIGEGDLEPKVLRRRYSQYGAVLTVEMFLEFCQSVILYAGR
jgi:hypothetical protein